ncbi:DNA mismatch repair protein MutS [Salinispira pacifica]|uniref:DNA mismatch repair protein MutS n=2 Tax=Salinispira pacifica TaxID=1307761 RepID=V5WI23_9SPIO|nr:DNA mismatch repair protein MutS [Salinispira pacifica]
MMQQYERIKSSHRDKILFFRLGDFYEMFKTDAKEASRVLGLTLTARNGIPMCGIPFHAASSYIPKLLEAGKKVAICEQTKMPEGGKGIAERQVVEILTPGTVFDEEFLKTGDHNFIASFSASESDPGRLSFSCIDVSTGNLILNSFASADMKSGLLRELARYNPREILIQETLFQSYPWLNQELGRSSLIINRFPDWHYSGSNGYGLLCDIMSLQNLKSYGLEPSNPELDSLSPLLQYVEENAGRKIRHINSLRVVQDDDHMLIDNNSQKNLELIRNTSDGSENQSLFTIINQTRTSMGRRLLKQWILEPLVDVSEIRRRQDFVELLYHDQLLLNRCRDILGKALDLPRLSARVAMEKAHPKDMKAIQNSLHSQLNLYELLHHSPLAEIFNAGSIPELKRAADMIGDAILDDPPTQINEGGIIRRGYDALVDELTDTESNAQDLLDAYLAREKELSGIGNLKIKFNKVVGYFLEVSKAQVKNIPCHFEPRQSLVNADRYTTAELQELAQRISSSRDQRMQREQELFIQLRNKVGEQLPVLQEAGEILAALDCIQSFAYQATLKGYTRPEMIEKQLMEIQGGGIRWWKHFWKTPPLFPTTPGSAETATIIFISSPVRIWPEKVRSCGKTP